MGAYSDTVKLRHSQLNAKLNLKSRFNCDNYAHLVVNCPDEF